MPLIILCGQPSSGKSNVASKIEAQLKKQQKEVLVISEQTLYQDRNAAYTGTYTSLHTHLPTLFRPQSRIL